jgi:hypothetical protein
MSAGWKRQAVAVAICAVVVGCAAGCARECPRRICPRNTVTWHALNDSSVTWAVGDSTPITATGFGQAGAASCSYRVSPSYIWDTPNSDAGAETINDGYISITCHTMDGESIDLSVNHIGDVRDWSVGTFTATMPGLTAYVPPTDATPNLCEAPPNLAAIPATVTVETASGGPLPLPKMVTDDFARTFWFDFDIPAGVYTDLNAVSCEFPATAHVSLHLTQTAADYVHDPNALCGCG